MKTLSFLIALLALACPSSPAFAQGTAVPAPAEMSLIDFNSPAAPKQVTPAKGVPAGSTITVDKTGINVRFTPWQKGDADHPGFHLAPASGPMWDLSAYGHVEAQVTNTGDRGFTMIIHLVDRGEGYWTEKKVEPLELKPGETKVIKVIFGYQKGFRPGPPVNAAAMQEIYFGLYHSIAPHSFRIAYVKAGGTAGEKPPGAQP